MFLEHVSASSDNGGKKSDYTKGKQVTCMQGTPKEVSNLVEIGLTHPKKKKKAVLRRLYI